MLNQGTHGGKRTIIASKTDVLEFIYKSEYVTIRDLMERFGYTYKGAWSKLVRLKHNGLVKPSYDNNWTITDSGIRRLGYYGRA